MSNQDSASALFVSETDSVFTLHFEGNTYHFPQGSTSEIDVEHLQVIRSTAGSIKANFGGLFQSITDVFELLCNPEWVHVDQTFDRLENIINGICYKVIPSRQRELAVYLKVFHSQTNKTYAKQQLYLRRVYKEPSSKRRYEKIHRVPLLSSFFKKLHGYSEAKTSALYRKLVASNHITMICKTNVKEKELILLQLNNMMLSMVAIYNKGIAVSRFGEEQNQDQRKKQRC